MQRNAAPFIYAQGGYAYRYCRHGRSRFSRRRQSRFTSRDATVILRSVFREAKTSQAFTCGQTLGFVGFLFLFLLAPVAGGAPVISQYGSRLWRMDDGLPHSCVQAVLQTRDGYLWVGTQYGLARFDGVRFVGFNKNNVPEMLNANILGLQESQDGSLWIATGRGGMIRLKDGKFTRHGKADGLANDSCLGATLESRDGSLWFATLGGLSRYRDGKFVNFGANSGLASDVVRGMSEDQQGQLWLATPKGVYCWKDGVVIRHFRTEDGLRINDARAIYCDPDGTIWVGAGNGLSRIQEGRVTTFAMDDSPANNIITHIQRDRRGNLWVGSYGGLSRFVDGKIISQLDGQGQAFDLVNAIFEDREGNLWIGSRDGLMRLNSHPFTSYTQQHGLSCNNVTSVLEGKDGVIWAATWGGGVNRLKDGVFTVLPNEGSSLALGLWEDSAQRVWAGTDWDGGLFKFDQRTVRRYTASDGLTGGAVRVVYQDRSGVYWLGTTRGLYRMEGQTIRAFGVEHGMPAEVIRAICEDDQGDLWIGTNDGLWHLRQGVLVRFTTADGLSNTTTGALYADHHGNLWIGTSGGGLNRLRNGRFSVYNSRRGLFNDSIYEIVEDENGWLWMTCIRGIFRVHRDDLDRLDEGSINTIHCIAYGNPDGLASEVCSLVAKPAAWKSKDGRLWFATAKGLSVIDPKSPKEENLVPPPVILERILTDKQTFPSAETLSVAGPVRIPPGRGELEFQYTALTFRVPERTRFKYQLEGVDTDWVEAGARRSAHYSNVYPGKYRFRVLARNSESTWGEPGCSMEFVVLPHVWQTWWFKLVILALAVLGALGLHRVHLARFRQLENLRLRLAADLHDEVGSNLSTISLLARKLQKGGAAGTEAADDVAAINRISGQTSSSIREIAWFINPENDTLQDLILRMKETANTMLPGMECRFQNTQERLTRTLPPQFRQDIFLLYKEMLANIAKHSRASRVEVEVSQLDSLWQLRVRDNGVGFDTRPTYAGNGLKNSRLRAARLNASWNIESGPDSGTTATFSVRIP
jgi:ligand-binding sensor domain-containing protein/signal transduction histidine kinase